ARMRKSAPMSPSKNPSLSHDSASVFTAGDDCAINELLEGWMELDVFLPDGRKIRTTVERRTPMMDLLVQVTTSNKISPAGHVIQILTDRGKIIQYKPNTPIGSLDSTVIYIVPKSSILQPTIKRMSKIPSQPFE
ncbi:cordon-bleu protein-like 1, partial [Limulus polyphemus]|uniref:Cordon-bleu protein-like 1 n=1 Tax=Limulus polyphemus TaxID=6850 RepID=A0ABM1C3B4_LIMPO